MSYNIYPVITVAFLIDAETATYINLADAKQSGIIDSKDVSELLESGVSESSALAEEYQDIMDAISNIDRLNPLCLSCCHGEFEGEAVTAFPERAEKNEVLKFDSDQIAYLLPSREPGLFAHCCYKDEQELMEEFQTIFKDAGVEMPSNYNWWAHIVNITGTYGC